MKDWSQHGEQAHILKFFGDFKGRFLDLGAFDGVTGSNTRALACLGWTGLCVEANPLNFVRLLELPYSHVQYLNAAVSDTPGIVSLKDSGQLSCGRKDILPDSFVKRQFDVAAITPSMIASKFGNDFGFISLDIEGMDLEVLLELSPICEMAKLICIEDSLPFHAFDREYYDQLRFAAATLGFSRVIARTPDDKGTGNTLLAKE